MYTVLIVISNHQNYTCCSSFVVCFGKKTGTYELSRKNR